jgi:mono/diheme cytochrome c family protein
MKRLWALSLVAIAGVFMLYQDTPLPIYAASGKPSTGLGERASHPASEDTVALSGVQSYAEHCAICHGEHREGILPAFPPLLGIGRQMTDSQITDLIHSGKGRMPGFPGLKQEELTALLRYLATPEISVTAGSPETSTASAGSSGMVEVGHSLFQQNCAFCHGRDAGGGETGPDLTRSKLVSADVGGDKISEVVRNGRLEKKMPRFNFSDQELLGLAAFIHAQEAKALAQKGDRRGVDVSDLQTGNVEAGKQYFNGAGTCSTCHSATGDLAGIASRYQGLQLESRMLYPSGVKSRVSVTTASGQTIKGTLAYLDEFTVGLRDSDGRYRSWPVSNVKYVVDAPVEGHVRMFSKYTDADIHNLMAYLQTLR